MPRKKEKGGEQERERAGRNGNRELSEEKISEK